MHSRITRTMTAVSLVAMTGVAVAGCGSAGGSSSSQGTTSSSQATTTSSQATTSSSAPAQKNITIGGVPGVSHNPFYQSVGRGAQAAAKKYGITVDWQGPTNFAASPQIQIINSLLSKKVSGLMFAPTDPNALEPSVKKANADNVPVVTFDTELANSSGLLTQITTQDVEGGKQAADILGKLIGGSGQIGVMTLPPNVTTGVLRLKGFKEEIKAKFPHIKIVSIQSDQHSATVTQNDTSHMLQRYPNLKGMYAVNDTCVQGIVAALKSAHKTGSVKVVGYDAMPQEVQYLKAGDVQALIVQKAYEEGYLGVQYLYDKITGKATPPKTKKLNNVVATQKNMNQPNVKKYFYKTN